jgi:nucleoside-diphosphate-sugar epimerase
MAYGPGDYQHRLFSYLKRMVVDDRPMIILDRPGSEWRASRADVANVAHAVVLAVDKRAGGHIFNISESEYLEAEWVQQIADAIGYEGRLVIVPPIIRWPADFRIGPSTLRPFEHN